MERREALNAFNTDQLESMLAAVNEVSESAEIRVAVLTGAGDKGFAAGADIKEMSAKTPAEAQVFAALGHAIGRAISASAKPWIAAVNGYAFGGGCEMALACDIRFAAENAVFAQPEVGLGIPPGWGATQRLPRIVGPGLAAEMILSGRWVRAEEALQAGLVSAVFPAGELLERAIELGEKIAANAPLAVGASKRLMSLAFDVDPDIGLDHERQAFALLFGTDDQREGMQAFVEKREASFKGR
jgi:enoyl-CoA hydratase